MTTQPPAAEPSDAAVARPSTESWKQAYSEVAKIPLSEIKGGLWNAVETRARELDAIRNPEADAGGGKAGRAEFVKGYLLASMAHAHSSLKIETLERHADLAADKAGYAPQPTTPPGEAVSGDDRYVRVGDLAAPITNPEAWPTGYADGFNDYARLVSETPSYAIEALAKREGGECAACSARDARPARQRDLPPDQRMTGEQFDAKLEALANRTMDFPERSVRCVFYDDKGNAIGGVKRATPAVEVAYDRELIACMLDNYFDGMKDRDYHDTTVHQQIELLRAADNRDASGVRTVCRHAVEVTDSGADFHTRFQRAANVMCATYRREVGKQLLLSVAELMAYDVLKADAALTASRKGG